MINVTSAGIGENYDKEGRKDYSDKSDPVREYDCIWCMARVTVCPTQAIKVDEANLDIHNKTAETATKD
jgi:formate hydrogenlyase subunit 6/NADH:ubiquinone oxidoreductase subunit I